MSASGRTDSSSLSRNTSTAMGIDDGTGEEVFISVKKEYKQSKATLVWALKNNLAAKKVVLVHVHQPPQMIPMMGGRFPASQLKKEQVEAYRQVEREKINRDLNEYLVICSGAKVQAEMLVIEMDDIARGLIEVIAEHGVTRLVMGAAADKHYSKKMTVPRSKTAITVLKEAAPSCNVWFICKGNLICTRDGCEISGSQMGSSSIRSSEIGSSHSGSTSQSSQHSDRIQDFLTHMKVSYNSNSVVGETGGPLSEIVEPDGPTTPQSWFDEKASPLREGAQRSPRGPDPYSWSEGDEEVNRLHSISMTSSITTESASLSKPLHKLEEDDASINDLYDKLHQAILEAEKSKNDAHQESKKRRKAEMELLDANCRARVLEAKLSQEMKLRIELKGALAREKLELERFKSQSPEVLELQKAKDFEEVVSELQHLLHTLQIERDELRWERDDLQMERDKLQKECDDAVREVEKLQLMREERSCTCGSPKFSEFSYKELQESTRNFEDSLKIGEFGYGSAYKGSLRQTMVTIKMLQPHCSLSEPEFYQEAEALGRVRHPNMVTLIGTCPEARALIYEFLPCGNLEDHLSCRDGTPPLSWEVRTRIIVEICSVLVFLNSNTPHSLVHGDLRPANILLDANFMSKVADFGLSNLLQSTTMTTTTTYRWSDSKVTFGYMDPEFFSTGELTTSSDLYSFGIILLRLLTGMPAIGVVREVQGALEDGKLQDILDSTTGEWPILQAMQLVHLGLKCCEMNRKSRPDLVGEVWSVLQTIN